MTDAGLGWRIETAHGGASLALSTRVWACYSTVFDDFTEYDTWRIDLFERHALREGHRLVVAVDDDEVIGFGWGYTGQRGQFWTDLADAALPDDIATEWLGGHFEFVELGVLPGKRGEGIGRALHDALLDGVDRRSVLSTKDDGDDPAVRLYLDAGWRRLGALSPGVQVMGLDRT